MGKRVILLQFITNILTDECYDNDWHTENLM